MENYNTSLSTTLDEELEKAPWVDPTYRISNKTLHHALSLLAFIIGITIINSQIFITGILYRWAANDLQSVASNLSTLSLQFALLYAALVIFTTKNYRILLAIISVSALTNVCYSQVLATPLTIPAVEWMLSESRQAGSAIKEFSTSVIIALIKVLSAIALIAYARKMSPLRFSKILDASRTQCTIAITAIMLLIYGFAPSIGGSRGAELNVYRMAFDAITITYPERRPIEENPIEIAKVKKIVWLVDESISYSQFHSLSAPMLSRIPSRYKTIDLGNSLSFANCSAQSNAAMRWGVNVANVNSKTDLRTTPTIWAYAKAAGFQTTLIDGQIAGAPQNFIWAPEQKLINHVVPALKGIDTDRAIAEKLNKMLRSEQKDFIYVVFRGAHYQYSSNYPADPTLEKSSLIDRYRRAITYSKERVFETIFAGLNRDNIAVFYTSDHGQVVESGRVPHCNENPDPDEFSVPMLLIAPVNSTWAGSFKYDELTQHSASQIFPTALWLMGYSRNYAERNYDALLDKPPKAIVKFGKSIVPRSTGDSIQVNVIDLNRPL